LNDPYHEENVAYVKRDCASGDEDGGGECQADVGVVTSRSNAHGSADNANCGEGEERVEEEELVVGCFVGLFEAEGEEEAGQEEDEEDGGWWDVGGFCSGSAEGVGDRGVWAWHFVVVVGGVGGVCSVGEVFKKDVDGGVDVGH